MKKLIASLLPLCMCASVQAMAGDPLQSGFANPPVPAKPMTWWHWVNGNVSKAAVTADLEAMKRQGIHGLTLFNADMGFQNGELTFLSPEWLEHFRFAALELQRLGMEMSFFNSAGWSTTGGPWITPEHSMQTVVYSETVCEGGKVFKGELPLPAVRMNHYRDIAVLAFPKPSGDLRISDLGMKTLANYSFRNHLEPDDMRIDRSAVTDKNNIIELTSGMTADGLLEWSVPAGEWVVLRIGHTTTGRTVFPAIRGGHGLECDKMSRAAIDMHWEGAVMPILNKVRDLVGSTITGCMQDSYEAGCGNWTRGFEDEFSRRRGYDCLPYLPALAGYYVDSGEISERFLWDFRRTIGDLVADNYYGRLGELCRANGLKFAVEPYGGPFEGLQAGSSGDIIMGEFWVDRIVMDSPRLAASIAHTNGIQVVGSEAFTNYGGLRNHPATLKPYSDKAWTEGVNRLTFHTFVHQPWNVGPGLTLGKYGMDFHRLNTWWEPGKAFVDYVARSQFLLQQGRFAADVLVFGGEESPNNSLPAPSIRALGYDYDFIGSNKIRELTVRYGMICTPAGGIYRVLVLPRTTWMSPGILEKIGELAKDGAAIIGPKPHRSPGLTGFPECDARVGALADCLWDSGLITDMSLPEAVAALNLTPDFSTGVYDGNFNFIHRITDNADIYFIASANEGHTGKICRFRIADKQPEIWNPETGKIEEAAVWYENKDGTTSVPVGFDPNGATFVVFRKPARPHIVRVEAESQQQAPRLISNGKKTVWETPYPGRIDYETSMGARKSIRVKSIPAPVELTGAWDVGFMPDRGAPAETVFDSLISWPDSSDEGIRYYSGTAVYRNQFLLPKDAIRAGRLELDLGTVDVIAEVILNGKNLGILWKAPFRIDIGEAAKVGSNDLEVRVTNLWANRLTGDERLPEDYERQGRLATKWPEWLLNGGYRSSQRVTFTTWKHWDADSPLMPSGLRGPVVVTPYVHAAVK